MSHKLDAVAELLDDAGLGPWLTFPTWNLLVVLADSLAHTVRNPISRAEFVAQAARELSKIRPVALEARADREAIENELAYFLYADHGVEVWGNVMQWFAPAES